MENEEFVIGKQDQVISYSVYEEFMREIVQSSGEYDFYFNSPKEYSIKLNEMINKLGVKIEDLQAIVSWVCVIAKKIDNVSGFLDSACELLRVALDIINSHIQNALKDIIKKEDADALLEPIHQLLRDMQELEYLVYKCDFDSSFSFDKWEKMTRIEKLLNLARDGDSTNIVDMLCTRYLPGYQNLGAKESNPYLKALKAFLIYRVTGHLYLNSSNNELADDSNISTVNKRIDDSVNGLEGLAMCAEVINQSRPIKKENGGVDQKLRIIPTYRVDGIVFLLEIALKSVYSLEYKFLKRGPKGLQLFSKIFLSLPTRNPALEQKYPVLANLQDEVDAFDMDLKALEVVFEYLGNDKILDQNKVGLDFFRKCHAIMRDDMNAPVVSKYFSLNNGCMFLSPASLSSEYSFIVNDPGVTIIDQLLRTVAKNPDAVNQDMWTKFMRKLLLVRCALDYIPLHYCHAKALLYLLRMKKYDLAHEMLSSLGISPDLDDMISLSTQSDAKSSSKAAATAAVPLTPTKGSVSANANVNDPQLLPMNKELAEQVIITAAREFFDSAPDVTDINISLAQKCLSVLPFGSEAIKKEKDLYEAIILLIKDLELPMIPLQVRMALDISLKSRSNKKTKINNSVSNASFNDEIEDIFSGINQQSFSGDEYSIIRRLLRENPLAYKPSTSSQVSFQIPGVKILRFANLVGWNTPLHRLAIQGIIIECALKHEDFASALLICDDILQRLKSTEMNSELKHFATNALITVAQCRTFQDKNKRRELCNIALENCPASLLSKLLNVSRSINDEALINDSAVKIIEPTIISGQGGDETNTNVMIFSGDNASILKWSFHEKSQFQHNLVASTLAQILFGIILDNNNNSTKEADSIKDMLLAELSSRKDNVNQNKSHHNWTLFGDFVRACLVGLLSCSKYPSFSDTFAHFIVMDEISLSRYLGEHQKFFDNLPDKLDNIKSIFEGLFDVLSNEYSSYLKRQQISLLTANMYEEEDEEAGKGSMAIIGKQERMSTSTKKKGMSVLEVDVSRFESDAYYRNEIFNSAILRISLYIRERRGRKHAKQLFDQISKLFNKEHSQFSIAVQVLQSFFNLGRNMDGVGGLEADPDDAEESIKLNLSHQNPEEIQKAKALQPIGWKEEMKELRIWDVLTTQYSALVALFVSIDCWSLIPDEAESGEYLFALNLIKDCLSGITEVNAADAKSIEVRGKLDILEKKLDDLNKSTPRLNIHALFHSPTDIVQEYLSLSQDMGLILKQSDNAHESIRNIGATLIKRLNDHVNAPKDHEMALDSVVKVMDVDNAVNFVKLIVSSITDVQPPLRPSEIVERYLEETLQVSDSIFKKHFASSDINVEPASSFIVGRKMYKSCESLFGKLVPYDAAKLGSVIAFRGGNVLSIMDHELRLRIISLLHDNMMKMKPTKNVSQKDISQAEIFLKQLQTLLQQISDCSALDEELISSIEHNLSLKYKWHGIESFHQYRDTMLLALTDGVVVKHVTKLEGLSSSSSTLSQRLLSQFDANEGKEKSSEQYWADVIEFAIVHLASQSNSKLDQLIQSLNSTNESELKELYFARMTGVLKNKSIPFSTRSNLSAMISSLGVMRHSIKMTRIEMLVANAFPNFDGASDKPSELLVVIKSLISALPTPVDLTQGRMVCEILFEITTLETYSMNKSVILDKICRYLVSNDDLEGNDIVNIDDLDGVNDTIKELRECWNIIFLKFNESKNATDIFIWKRKLSEVSFSFHPQMELQLFEKLSEGDVHGDNFILISSLGLLFSYSLKLRLNAIDYFINNANQRILNKNSTLKEWISLHIQSFGVDARLRNVDNGRLWNLLIDEIHNKNCLDKIGFDAFYVGSSSFSILSMISQGLIDDAAMFLQNHRRFSQRLLKSNPLMGKQLLKKYVIELKEVLKPSEARVGLANYCLEQLDIVESLYMQRQKQREEEFENEEVDDEIDNIQETVAATDTAAISSTSNDNKEQVKNENDDWNDWDWEEDNQNNEEQMQHLKKQQEEEEKAKKASKTDDWLDWSNDEQINTYEVNITVSLCKAVSK